MTTPEDRVPAPAPTPGDSDADYSATVLASHWFQRPEPDRTATTAVPAATLPEAAATPPKPPEARPDRVEGTVLRFGPGVTAAHTSRTLPTITVSPVPPRPRRRLRRHALPASVLVCVIAFLLWQRLGPPIGVRGVTVASRPAAVGCDGTADIVGLVTTNGRPGALAYRWYRSDGTSSATLHESLTRGEHHARLHLRWTFQGKGRYDARAELRILSPGRRSATTRLTYDCS